MKYIIFFLATLILSSCEAELSNEAPAPASCAYKIIDKMEFQMIGGEYRQAIQLGGELGLGYYMNEHTTYFVLIDSSDWSHYKVGDYFPIKPNQ